MNLTMREYSVSTAIAIILSLWTMVISGGVEIVEKYPTYYLKPDKGSRIVREVVYKELERITKYRSYPDVALTAGSIYSIYLTYRELNYSVPELLSTYQTLDKRSEERIRIESIPWEIVPRDIVERCLDSNMELQVTSELMEYLGFSCGETIFDKYRYPSRVIDKSSSELIVSPTYDSDTGKLLRREYLFYDEESDIYRRALVRKLSSYATSKTVKELEYVVEMFNPENERNSLGLRPKLLASTILSILRCLKEYREQYFSSSYIERLAKKSVSELRKERLEDEREYAISLKGKYDEDTSVLWRYGQLSD